MFTQLRLKNFKAWKGEQVVDLASLSLFLGTNSAGKTSLLFDIQKPGLAEYKNGQFTRHQVMGTNPDVKTKLRAAARSAGVIWG